MPGLMYTIWEDDMKQISKTIAKMTIVFFCAFVFFSFLWLKNSIWNLTFGEILFHLLMPIEGAGREILLSFEKNVLINLIKFFIAYITIKLLLKKLPLKIKNHSLNLDQYSTKMDVLTAFVFLVISLKIFIIDFKFYDYVKQNITYTDIYKQEYIDPMNVSFKFPEKKRNLILIILESMETTFFAKEYGGAFDEDLIPELRKLAKENLHFSDTSSLGGTLQIEGTNWTMSAIVGMTLGIPIVTTIDGFDVDWNGFDRYVNFKKTRFLPGIIGLTDILGNAGYDQRFLIGSDKKFAGRDLFFSTHGNVVIKDLDYFKNVGKIPKDYHVFWGFEDEKLYQFAKEELIDLSSSSKPFNLILLTVDTHFPKGYLSKTCKKISHFDEQYKNVLSCASKQLYAFITWIKKQPFYNNTTIVILGDHLFMDDGTFIPKNAKRRIYNVFINTPIKPVKEKNRQFSTLDMFPTILDSINIQYNSPGLGLGRSLFKDTPTLIEKYGYEKFNQEVTKKSKEYITFWKENKTSRIQVVLHNK